ncbi:hemerythrin domain-containing protein [Paenibacillus rigui]|uniref:Hemerythrin n=1 Tax=Paenibacillus rigui TaxID=554312 RepID=A0A229UKU9_9BACL|nr:hemerythrin domain-containing protein [Paenibacillus rigui]OXM84013.1 hemerythrin [Paenibacillus rigui]
MNMPMKPQADSGTAHITELAVVLDRLKQEHSELMQVLTEMEEQAVQAELETDKHRALGSLLHLRLWTLAFKEELDRHSEWEEKELFPFLNAYFRHSAFPTVMASFLSLEKDHELAMNYMQSFLRSVHALKSDSDAMRMKQAAALLTHACRILRSHLEKEEQLVFPMTEKVLTDIDSLFS